MDGEYSTFPLLLWPWHCCWSMAFVLGPVSCCPTNLLEPAMQRIPAFLPLNGPIEYKVIRMDVANHGSSYIKSNGGSGSSEGAIVIHCMTLLVHHLVVGVIWPLDHLHKCCGVRITYTAFSPTLCD